MNEDTPLDGATASDALTVSRLSVGDNNCMLAALATMLRDNAPQVDWQPSKLEDRCPIMVLNPYASLQQVQCGRLQSSWDAPFCRQHAHCNVNGCDALNAVGIYCEAHAPSPLSTLIKYLPGYMCSSCTESLEALSDDRVACRNGHMFERNAAP